MRVKLLILVFLSANFSLVAQKQVKFQIVNVADGEGMGYTRIQYQNSSLISDQYGFVSIHVPQIIGDSLWFCLSHVNISDTCFSLLISKIERPIHRIKVFTGTNLDAVDLVVQRNMVGLHGGRVQIGEELIEKTPTMFGEKDVFRSLQMLPQVTMGSEFSSDLHIRGADLGHSLVLVDGIPLLNLSHFYGLFAAINPNTIKTADLYPGVSPSRYNGRVGGFLDISLKEGNMTEFHGEAGIGLIMSNIRLEGPLIKNKSSFHFSTRRSYIDLMARPFMSGNEFITSNMADYMLKYQHRLGKKDLLIVSSYFNRDFAYSPIVSGAVSDGVSENIWGNSTASIRWLHTLNSSTQLTTKAYFSRYDYRIFEDVLQFTPQVNLEENLITEFDNAFENFGFGVDGQTWKRKHHFSYGLSSSKHRLFLPKVFSKVVNLDSGDEEVFIDNKIEDRSLTDFTAYFEDKYFFNENFSISLGVNFMHYFELVETRNTFLMPRITFDYRPVKSVVVFGGWGMSNQALHHIRFSRIQMPADMWINASAELPVSVAKMYNLGSKVEFSKKWQFSIEGYYRPIDNVVVRREGVSMFLSTDEPEESLFNAVASTYGLEFSTTFSFGVFFGMISYALMNSTRQSDSLNNGLAFPYDFLRQHNLNMFLTAQIKKRFNINAGFTYGSGLPYQMAFQKIPVHPSLFFSTSTQSVDFIPSKNNYQMPDFHVLNIGFDWAKKSKRFTHKYNVDLYNIYFRANPFYLDFTRDPAPLQTYSLRMFSSFLFVPSFSYTLMF